MKQNTIDPAQISLEAQGFVRAAQKTWVFDPRYPGKLLLAGREICFSEAAQQAHRAIESGLGEGTAVRYSGFAGLDLAFETRVLPNRTTGFVDCTFVPLAGCEGILHVAWPPPLVAEEPGSYAVLNTMQGQLLPADWPEAVCEKLPFDGQMGSEAAYMPWWGEITPEGGYLAWVRSPWDSAYTIEHPAGGPNRIWVRHLPSLGRMAYARTVTYCFTPAGGDYVDLCKLYRSLAEEEGKAVTLCQKAAANPVVDRLVGCCVLHADVKKHVAPESFYYDPEHPERNDSLTPFAHWEERAEALKGLGVEQLYLHLDGWGQPGYDNQHPDYGPPCAEAGGAEGLRSLREKLAGLGYLFGIHDQYRDYYLDAPSYDPENALRGADGSLFEMSRWAGGRQNYLCASLAPDYVKRNFQALFDQGITLDAAYLDVFTCNELDECDHPAHRMTRQQCIAWRNQCFAYLTAHGIAPSSEEVNDWAMPELVFCHWAPYYQSTAIPVPLFSLVYHDCVMIPWVMEGDTWGIPQGTQGFLHALLGGGMGYLGERFSGDALAENIRKVQVLSALHRRVAKQPMTGHRFLSEDRSRQQTTFGDGTTVTVDFAQGTYEIG